MIVPSIDLSGGRTVQLVGGEDLAIDAGDPRPIADRFGRVGEVAVIDLDAARGIGENSELVRALLGRARCRVGGGIRDAATARRWLDAGAAKVILGTAARPEVLTALPRERVIASVDARDGEVVVDGWRTRTGRDLVATLRELRPYVGGFLVTFVEHEGRMAGTAVDRLDAVREAAGDAALTIAGGITTAAEIAALDRMGIDAQVGMALYSGRLSLADAFAAPLRSDRPDGLWATVVVDASERALGLCWSNAASLEAALDRGVGVYWSRSRGLWEKGATSGAGQRLLRVDLDCDRDAMRFRVTQAPPGFCHTGTATCFGPARGFASLEATLQERVAHAPPGSYTRRLFEDPALLAAKLREEAGELAEATGHDEVAHEAADVVYFALVAAARAGVTLADIEAELDRRALTVTRRSGNAKEDR